MYNNYLSNIPKKLVNWTHLPYLVQVGGSVNNCAVSGLKKKSVLIFFITVAPVEEMSNNHDRMWCHSQATLGGSGKPLRFFSFCRVCVAE